MRDGDTGVEAGGAQLDFSELGPNPTSANSRFPPWIPHPFVPWGLSLRSADPKGQTVPRGGELRALLNWSEEAVPGTSVFPSGEPGVSGNFGGRRKAVRDRFAFQGGTGDFP